jgi:hypothetical protein
MTTTKVLPRWPRMYGHASRKNPTNSSPGSTPAPLPLPAWRTPQHRMLCGRRRGGGRLRLLPRAVASRDAGRDTPPARRAAATDEAMYANGERIRPTNPRELGPVEGTAAVCGE